jgi:GTP-binding nuclear protein Ran
MATQTHKIIIVGDAGVGKTVFINRHLNGDFVKQYIATMGVEVNPMIFDTNRGLMCLNLWDCAGQEKFSGMGSGYFTGAKGAIVMFDVLSMVSYNNVDSWVNKIRKTCGDIPIILCGNKVDIPQRKVKPKIINKHITLGLHKYFDISARSNYNYDKPFLALLRELEGDENIALSYYADLEAPVA